MPCRLPDLFITLNAVRLLSIASILLATAASIFIFVTDFSAYKLFWDAATQPGFDIPDAVVEMPYIPYEYPLAGTLT